MTHLILALDYGGTKLSAALFAGDPATPALLDLARVVTPASAGADYEWTAMLGMARHLLAGQNPVAVGVSFGGPVDFAAGTVRLSHHVPGWEAFPLRDRLAAEFGCFVATDNDANVAALGEHRFGAGRGASDLLYITVSTGVGGGWILGGRPWRGHEGMAGEIGHTVADPAGPLCLCGKRGCVERLASGPYMAADYEQRRADDGQHALEHDAAPDLSAGFRPVSGKDVAERAAAGDALAKAVLLRGAWALGVGIGHAANLINPQRFILGGGVTKAGPAWWAEVRRSAAATALPEVHYDVVPAALGDDAPLWGALALAQAENE